MSETPRTYVQHGSGMVPVSDGKGDWVSIDHYCQLKCDLAEAKHMHAEAIKEWSEALGLLRRIGNVLETTSPDYMPITTDERDALLREIRAVAP